MTRSTSIAPLIYQPPPIQAPRLVSPEITVVGPPAGEGLLRDTDAPGDLCNRTVEGYDHLRLPDLVDDFFGNPNIGPGIGFRGSGHPPDNAIPTPLFPLAIGYFEGRVSALSLFNLDFNMPVISGRQTALHEKCF